MGCDVLMNAFIIFSQDLFLGHALRDREPAIIHHFAFVHNPSQFAFPDFEAGWAITSPLLKM